QAPAARPIDFSTMHLGLGLRVEAPVVGLVKHRLPVTDRDVDPEIVVAWTRLEQQHRVPAVGAQAIGQHASGRSRTNDDVVEPCHASPSDLTCLIYRDIM